MQRKIFLKIYLSFPLLIEILSHFPILNTIYPYHHAMKKIKNLILFIVFGSTLGVSQTFSYFFQNYQVDAEILADGTIEVEEKIDADFSDEPE